jgi:hypothetical protein
MLSWGVIGYGAALSALLAALLVGFGAGSAGPRGWCARPPAPSWERSAGTRSCVRPTPASSSTTPRSRFPISWQDTGFGVFTIAVAVIVLGFGPVRADPARRLAVQAALAGLGALLVDIYLY